MTLGQRIRLERERRRWTQTELAHRAGISPSAVSRIEDGSRSDVLQATVDAIASAFGVPASAWTDHDLVFPDDDGRPIRESKAIKAWDKLLVSAGLPKCRIHDLRHLLAHTALDAGAELIEVSRLLGHANTSVTDRVYSGRHARGARRAAEAAAVVFGPDEA